MGKTIMIVEDEQSYHDIYKIILKERDYETIHAYDGDEALAIMEEKKPDLIIIDLLLDLVTGDTFFLYIKGMPEYSHIPVIFLSSCSKNRIKSLKQIDPGLVFFNKSELTKEKLLEEIDKKLLTPTLTGK